MAVDQLTGEEREMIDLDNSVFMNFVRYTKQDVENCYAADMGSSSFEKIVKREDDVSETDGRFEQF